MVILCVTLNPVIDTTLFIDAFEPVYRTEARRITHVAGGKGNNVARVLTRLGRPARALAALGGASGRHVAERLAADGIETIPAWVSGDTRVMITVVDRAYEQRAYFAPGAPFTAADASALRARFDEALEGASAVCLCGSSPGALADPLFPEMLALAAARGLPTLLDTYGEALRLGLEARPTVVKANQAEAAALLGRALEMADDQLRALDDLRRGGAHWAVLTLGAEGALFASEEGTWQARPPDVRVVNPIGSGDAMTAGLLIGLLDGQPPQDCFRLGMAAAVANTLSWHAGHLTAEEVEGLLPQIAIRQVRAG